MDVQCLGVDRNTYEDTVNKDRMNQTYNAILNKMWLSEFSSYEDNIGQLLMPIPTDRELDCSVEEIQSIDSFY